MPRPRSLSSASSDLHHPAFRPGRSCELHPPASGGGRGITRRSNRRPEASLRHFHERFDPYPPREVLKRPGAFALSGAGWRKPGPRSGRERGDNGHYRTLNSSSIRGLLSYNRINLRFLLPTVLYRAILTHDGRTKRAQKGGQEGHVTGRRVRTWRSGRTCWRNPLRSLRQQADRTSSIPEAIIEAKLKVRGGPLERGSRR
jgi:hypothetical protein